MYNVVIFAKNEEKSIGPCIISVLNGADSRMKKLYVIINGSTDNTLAIVQHLKTNMQIDNLEVIALSLADKCNAWNTYVHDVADKVSAHFFCDADVQFSDKCFSTMYEKLQRSQKETVLVAGMPLSGRNLRHYEDLIKTRNCFFGNLYGLKGEFIKRIRYERFKLPVGLNWIDSSLTKAINTDLRFDSIDMPRRTIWIDGVGYYFDSLSIFNLRDVRTYLERIARYELGKLQESILSEKHVTNWPENVFEINSKISAEFELRTQGMGIFKKYIVKKRLDRIIGRQNRG